MLLISAVERRRILLIEDDRDIADLYALRLAREGFVVSVAEDGERGRVLAKEHIPDLIYLDLRLPVMDGFEVLKQLKSDDRTSAIPVVILTNYGEKDLRLRGFELGATGFLVKAMTTPEELAERTASWTGQPRGRRRDEPSGA